MAFYLSVKEIWRNRSRYLLFSMVIALITTLVLFIAALAGGLANANKQFIEKLEADLLVFQENTELQATSSRLGPDKLREIRRLEGIAAAGPVGISTAKIVLSGEAEPLDVSLFGVEPGEPGDPELLAGPGLKSRRKDEAVIDESLAQAAQLSVGDRITVKTIQGTEEESFDLEIVGITSERQYFFQPALLVPLPVWEEIRPQPSPGSGQAEPVFNLIAVRLDNPAYRELAIAELAQKVDGIEVADKASAILAIPGYTAQQSTLNTQQGFTLLIGVLVVGGFFQIQTLQKVPQIGMLKAIGSSNRTVVTTAMLQILAVTLLGVGIGSLGTLLLSLGMPDNVPVLFTGTTFAAAIAALLSIGPLGGLVSIRLALKIDPLTAIGLSS